MNPILREKGSGRCWVSRSGPGRLIGVLHVGSLTPRKFTASDVRLLQLVADRVAMAIYAGLYERERSSPRRFSEPSFRTASRRRWSEFSLVPRRELERGRRRLVRRIHLPDGTWSSLSGMLSAVASAPHR